MNSAAVLIFTILTISYGMSVSPQKEKMQLDDDKIRGDKHMEELAFDDSIINLLPLKILLKYKLKTKEELQSEPKFQHKEKLKSNLNEENLKLPSVISRNENLPNGFCSEINLLRNLSLSEISSIINDDVKNKENSLTKVQLQKIYDSIKDCSYVKAVNAKLWGPLWHCLNRAARDGIVEVLRETTKRDCNAKDEDGMTPTLWAAFEGQLNALRLLVARGGDPDKSDNFGNTALHHSAERGHIACVRFLTNFGANLWSLNCDMHTPKELAAINNRGEILRFMDEAMAEQEATARKEVKIKKEKAQKEAEKKLKEYEKVKKKAEKYAEKEQKRLEKEREKMGEECVLKQGNSNRPSAVLQAFRSKPGAGSLIVRGVNSPSPKFSEIVGTVTEANAKKFGIGAVHKKINPIKFGNHKEEAVKNGDFKVVEIEDGKKSIKNLTGLRRDSEILYVGTYEKEKQSSGTRGKLSDVFKAENILTSDSSKQEDTCPDGAVLREPASIFERPGFGSFAFRNSLTATLNALPISGENNEIKETRGDESSISSAGSLKKRHYVSNPFKNTQWSMEEATDEDCDIGNVDDIDSLEDDESSPLELFLMSNGLKEYISRFLAEKIDLDSLIMLTDEDLISLGLPLGPRRKLMTAISNRKKALEEPGKVLDSQL